MRYRVDGIPPRAVAAFTPGLVLNGVSFGAGLRTIYGFPGTLPVPVDDDRSLANYGHTPGDKTAPSRNAPNEILPTVYIPGTRDMGPWGRRTAMHTRGIGFGGNPLPEPAGAPNGVPVPAATYIPRIGGRAVIGQPRVAPRWPSVNTGSA